MRPLPTLHVALTRAELRRGVLLVAKHRRPLDEPLGPGLRALAEQQARSATIAEARWLVAARDPGVVAVRRVEPSAARLWTGHAAVASLATAPPSSPVAARLLAQLAATAARLHHRGLAHGALKPEHVLLAPWARPIGSNHRRRPDNDSPVRAVLCSPSTGAATAGDDVDAVRLMVQRWRDQTERRQAAWDQALAAIDEARTGSDETSAMSSIADVLDELWHRLRRRPSAGEWLATARSRLPELATLPDGLRP